MDWMLTANLKKTAVMISDARTTFLGTMCPQAKSGQGTGYGGSAGRHSAVFSSYTAVKAGHRRQHLDIGS